MRSRTLATVVLMTMTFTSNAGKTYTTQQLAAMVKSGHYPAQEPDRPVKNDPERFIVCKRNIQRMRSQIDPSFPVKTIANSKSIYTVKFWMNDGVITATCSKPDGTVFMTEAGYK